jgi:hypothetical protein
VVAKEGFLSPSLVSASVKSAKSGKSAKSAKSLFSPFGKSTKWRNLDSNSQIHAKSHARNQASAT